jgi:LytS/YehU family sensor histidine kinase
MQLEKLHAELEYLKAQINPHFLFNSLNTVFFQIEKENQVARETLSKFSDMLRYQLYECTGNEIAIEKEIRYLQNYVDLQRLRKDENYSIQFTCSETLNHFSIPPLLLMPFIENAFKHVSHFSDRKNEIKISLNKSDNQFQLNVYNTKEPKPNTTIGGIGLKNAVRRLDLIYKDRYNLTFSEKPESYEVRLILNVTG